jgi:ABC-type lipoprotein release transport system permease subunit
MEPADPLTLCWTVAVPLTAVAAAYAPAPRASGVDPMSALRAG